MSYGRYDYAKKNRQIFKNKISYILEVYNEQEETRK